MRMMAKVKALGGSKLEKWERVAVNVGTLVALIGLYFLNESISASTKSLKIQQRAWLGISQAVLNHEPKDGEKVSVELSIVNKGISPAFDVSIKDRLSIFAKPIADDWKLVRHDTRGTIFQDAPGLAVTRGLIVDPGTEAAYMKGDLKIWITGEIRYSDAFGRPHWTRFCFSHDRTQNLALFSNCETGN